MKELTEKNPAAVALGSIKTERKTESSRANAAKARATKGELKPCTCNQTPHKLKCPVGLRERIAAIRARKQEAK